MTISEALDVLNNTEVIISHTLRDALNTAIESLEAWQKVRKDIDNQITATDDNDEYWQVYIAGLEYAIKSIEEHLPEEGAENGAV